MKKRRAARRRSRGRSHSASPKFKAGDAVVAHGSRAEIVHVLPGRPSTGDHQEMPHAYRVRILNQIGPDVYCTVREHELTARTWGRSSLRPRARARRRGHAKKTGKAPSSRTIAGATAIVKKALEKGVTLKARAPSGDTYTAGPYTPAVRDPHKPYVAYGYGKSRWLVPEYRGSAHEVAHFLVEHCGRGNALEAARAAVGPTLDHEALVAMGSRDRMDRTKSRIMHRRAPGW